MATPSTPRRSPPPDYGTVRPRRSAWSGVLIGVGIAAFVDETVFHQLLHWHHFYDKSTPGVGLVSDGLFHAFGWFAVVIGLVLVADLRRRGALTGRGLTGGSCWARGSSSSTTERSSTSCSSCTRSAITSTWSPMTGRGTCWR